MSLPNELLPVGLLGTGAAGGYQIERSLRFNSADSAYLSRTPASAGNRKTWTWSGWVKRAVLDGDQQLIFAAPSSTDTSHIRFDADNTLHVFEYTTNFVWQVRTSQVFRDVSSWYHILVAVDTTQSTDTNRVKIYVNGTQVTAFAASSYPTQNKDTEFNNTVEHAIGRNTFFANYLNGYLADIHFIDGQALDPTSFGEFDTNGIWQPIEYQGEYGTNGFHLPFSDNSTSSALGTDTSGNGNTWTVNNIIAGPAFTSNSWSGYFDGSGDYLTTPSSTAFDFGSGDFTIEFWVFTVQSGFQAFVGTRTGDTASTIRLSIFKDVSEVLSVNVRDTGNNDIASFSFQNTLPLNQWVHCSFVKSGTNFRLYQNGVQSTSSATSSASVNNSSNVIRVGNFDTSIISNLNGYISNLRILKGTALYTSNFTPPTSPLTAVTNTSLLTLQDSTFVDNSTNNFTITANGNARTDFRSPFEESVDTDSFVDSPTSYGIDDGLGGSVRGNYCTWNPLNNPPTSATLANGNLEVTANTTLFQAVTGTIFASSGKWYAEFLMQTTATDQVVGIAANTFVPSSAGNRYIGRTADSYGFYSDGRKIYNNTFSAYGTSWIVGDILQVALDLDNGKVWLGKNGTWQASGDPAAGTNAAFTGISGLYTFACSPYGTGKFFLNTGQRPFAYTAPEGFKSLCTTNLPEPTIADGSQYMDVLLWTGNGVSPRSYSGLSFSPDLAWIKQRSSTADHALIDTVRGTSAGSLSSNLTSGDSNAGLTVDSFDSGGFTLSTGSINFSYANTNTATYVAWAWDAGTSKVTNTDGSITSQVRANPSAGFSIVTYTGSSSNFTFGHGLGVEPRLLLFKNRSSSSNWFALTKATGSWIYGFLNTTDFLASALQSSNSSTVDLVNTANNSFNANGDNFVAYCFAPVAGYSAFGSYTGNGSADGPFVYTGFRPKYVIIKASSASGEWGITDSIRDPYNVVGNVLLAETSGADNTGLTLLDFTSNGFKLRNTNLNRNANSTTYIYAAFAENPFSLARAR